MTEQKHIIVIANSIILNSRGYFRFIHKSYILFKIGSIIPCRIIVCSWIKYILKTEALIVLIYLSLIGRTLLNIKKKRIALTISSGLQYLNVHFQIIFSQDVLYSIK